MLGPLSLWFSTLMLSHSGFELGARDGCGTAIYPATVAMPCIRERG